MKKITLPWLAFAALFFLMSCMTEDQPIVGSDNVVVMSTAKFTLDERSVSGNTFVAKGTVSNNGATKYSPTWYVEGEFYQDSTFKFKLGGTNQSYSFDLSKGETTGWQLSFTPSNIDVSKYPNFAVKNLRAYRAK